MGSLRLARRRQRRCRVRARRDSLGQRRTNRHVPGGRTPRWSGQDAPLHGGPVPCTRIPGREMTQTSPQQLIDPDLIADTEAGPRLIGSECRRCGTVTFPRQSSCAKCTSEDVHPRELATRGTLWTWTIQCFAPKAPPYLEGGVAEFEPYGVGYIELPGEVRVEGRLTESDPERLQI